jgi:hypothetical protein
MLLLATGIFVRMLNVKEKKKVDTFVVEDQGHPHN